MLRAKQFGCCLILTAAVLAGEATAQGPRSNSKTITWQSPSNAQDIQVGILGEIATPGVYHVDPGSLTVQSLVRRAGGLTSDASLSIRIIRQERVAQSLFFSPQADSRLLPGDVLIVESKRNSSGMSKVLENGNAPTSTLRQAAANPTDQTGVQVAYLNVLETPVVVKLHVEDARLDRVVQMLGQPIELAGAVKVIDSQRSVPLSAQVVSGSLRLADGSVLIFPKGSINRSKLPALPKAHDSEIATGALPSMLGGPLGHAPDLRSVGQMAPLIASPRREVPIYSNTPAPQPAFNTVTAPPSPTPLGPPVPQFNPEPSPTPVVSVRPRIATLPFTGEAQMRSSSNVNQLEPEPISSPTPRESIQSPTSRPETSNTESVRNSLPGSNELSGDATMIDLIEPVGASPFSVFQMFGILAGVSALIGSALLARKHFDRQAIIEHQPMLRKDLSIQEQPSIPTPELIDTEKQQDSAAPAMTPLDVALASVDSALENSLLDRLIRNELPLREEKTSFPDPINLQGRIAPRQIHRLDRAAESPIGSGPHFAMSGNLESTEQEADALELDAHPSSEAKFSGPHFGRRRSGAKPVTIGEASRASESIPRESSLSTPLADALRQLQGGTSS